MRRLRSLLALPLLVLSIASIASAILAGEARSVVTVRSLPTGAAVTVDGELRGRTPLQLELSSGQPHAIRVELGGFEAAEARVRPALRWGLGSSLLLGGLGLGVVQGAVELSTGSAFALEPAELLLRLRRRELGAAGAATIGACRPRWSW